jgi:hypothetical protein
MQLRRIPNTLRRQDCIRMVSQQTTQMSTPIAQVPQRQMRIPSNQQTPEGPLSRQRRTRSSSQIPYHQRQLHQSGVAAMPQH